MKGHYVKVAKGGHWEVGDKVHIHADKKRDGFYRIDGDFVIQKVVEKTSNYVILQFIVSDEKKCLREEQK